MDRNSFLLVTLAATLAAINGAQGKKLPFGVIACSRNLEDNSNCTLRTGQQAIPTVIKGNPSYGMVPLDPLRIPEISIDDSATPRQVSISLTMKDVDIVGLGNTKLTRIRMGRNVPNVLWEGRVPVLSLLGRYKVSGRVLILPIRGNGAMNITLENVDFKYTFKHGPTVTRNNAEYITVEDNKLDFTTTRCHIALENLFNGDKRLSDQMNVFLNENWREMVEDLGPPIAESLNSAFSQLITQLTRQVPYDDIFPDTPAN